MNLPMKQKQTHRHKKTDLWLPRRARGKEAMVWGIWVSGCKLLHTEWINNRVLPHSTGNYI